MEKRTFSYKRATQRIYLYVVDALIKKKTLQRISEGLRNIVNSYSDLNRDDKYRIYLDTYNCVRAVRHFSDPIKRFRQKQYFDIISTACRVAKSKSNLRKKKKQVRAMLKDNNVVFMFCSQHEKPAKDHAMFQGRVYVDRFWRTKVDSSLIYPIQSYIKNRKIKTVQEIMGAPVYLITRPNCKHYFIPLETSTVLRSSLAKLRKDIGYRKDIPYTPKEKQMLYNQIWNSVDSYLNSI